MPTLGEVTELLDEWFPPHHADSWDAVGLVCGDPDGRRTPDPAGRRPGRRRRRRGGRGRTRSCWSATTRCSSRACTVSPPPTPRGGSCTGCSRRAADCSPRTPTPTPRRAGSRSRWPLALGLAGRPAARGRPGAAAGQDRRVRAGRRRRAGSGRRSPRPAPGAIGDYDSVHASPPPARGGSGRSTGASPTIGEVGRVEMVEEVRIETVCPRHLRGDAVAAMLAAHPYEEPAYDVIELAGARRAGPRLGPDRPAGVADDAARVRRARRGGAQRDRPRRAGRGRPGPDGRDRRAVRRRRATSCSTGPAPRAWTST